MIKKMKYRHISLVITMLTVGFMALAGVQYARAEDSVIRPISDFVDTQGTYCIDDGAGGCYLLVPPLENFLGWFDPSNPGRLSSIDYAGIAEDYIVSNGGTPLGTQTSGTVVERPLDDGRAEVSVVLQTKNALTWVTPDGDYATGDENLIFGHKVLEVMSGATPGLCQSLFKLTFINSSPGADLPDLVQLAFFPEPDQELQSVSIQCNADGPLREAFGVVDGTPGKANTVEVGLFATGAAGPVFDGFPVEFIKVHAIGD